MSEAALLDSPPSLFAPGGPVSAAAIAELRAHPNFPNAIRTLGSGMLALYRGNRLLNMLINDRGRMVIGYLSLYLHEGGAPDGRGSGFGVGQLKALCAAAGLASPGRTAAMLALMRMSGHIARHRRPKTSAATSWFRPRSCARRIATAGSASSRRCARYALTRRRPSSRRSGIRRRLCAGHGGSLPRRLSHDRDGARHGAVPRPQRRADGPVQHPARRHEATTRCRRAARCRSRSRRSRTASASRGRMCARCCAMPRMRA